MSLAPTPVGAYEAIIKTGKIFYISGQLPIKNGKLLYKGKLGKDLSIEEGYAAAELCALNLLSQLGSNLQQYKVKQIIKIEGAINCCESFTLHADILNGASNLLSKILLDKSGHTRTVIGCNSLPLNAAIEISAIIEVE